MVFTNLPRAEQYRCLFVCRARSRAAAAEFYREVKFSPGMLSYLRENDLLEYDANNNGPARTLPNGGYVESLKVLEERVGDARLTTSEMFVLLSGIPRLRVIDLKEPRKLVSFLERVHQLEFGQVPRQAYSLTRLERIVLPTDVPSGCMTKYYRICYFNYTSITHLTIVDNDESHTCIARLGFAGLEEFKNYFPRLTQYQLL
jgi:hypothetical protein